MSKFSWDNVTIVGRKKTPPKTLRKPVGESWDQGARFGMDVAKSGKLFVEKYEVDRGVLIEP